MKVVGLVAGCCVATLSCQGAPAAATSCCCDLLGWDSLRPEVAVVPLPNLPCIGQGSTANSALTYRPKEGWMVQGTTLLHLCNELLSRHVTFR